MTNQPRYFHRKASEFLHEIVDRKTGNVVANVAHDASDPGRADRAVGYRNDHERKQMERQAGA